MVKQIVESAGGHIGVESAGRNKGSTFKISMRMQAVGPSKTSHQLHNSLLRMTDNANDRDKDDDEDDLEAPKVLFMDVKNVESLPKLDSARRGTFAAAHAKTNACE